MVKWRGRGERKPGWSTQANEIVNRVFAYGTFRSGQSARAMIAGHVTATTPCTAPGQIFALPDGKAGMVIVDDGMVIGEILELTELTAALALLDAYEGDDYERTLRQVTLADGSQVWAWCYVLANPDDAHDWNIFVDRGAKRDRTDRVVIRFRKPAP